ncbi:MAG: hypothetical protein FWD31_06735 [Planctomycetaceae bacterium]|nr:hypothetical protein [Planctomycetaceae bacterium]
MTIEIARRVIEKMQKKGIGLDLAAEINGFVTGNLCTPDEAEQLRREYGLAAAVSSAVPVESELSPILQIDWGMDLKPGTHLTPEFTILGLDTQDAPLVHFPLDNRIQCEGWNPMPQLSRNHRGRQFYQPLRLHEPGQYLLQVTLIDPTPGQTEPGCYRCHFRVIVPDSDFGRRARSLEITADGLTANLPNLLDGYDHVKINVNNDAVINAPGKSPVMDKISQMFQPAQSGNQPNETRHLTTLKFFPDKQLAAKIPYVNIREPKTALSHAVLHIEKHPTIHLVSGNVLTFGRNNPENNFFNDVPLEIFPVSDNDETETAAFSLLNRLFSRNHGLVKVNDHHVEFFDCRKNGISDGTIHNDQVLPKGQSVPIFSPDTENGKSQAILFSKMLAMQVTPYCETVVMEGCEELPEPLLTQLYGENPLQPRLVSAVKVTRDKYLKQGDHAKDLRDALQKSLKEKPPAVSEWLTQWLDVKKYRDCRFEREEHLLIVTSATLGGGRGQVMTIPGHNGIGVQLRILNLDNKLYLENTATIATTMTQLVAEVNGTEPVLIKPFRPIPIQSGMVVRKGNNVLFRIEGRSS